MEQARPFPRLSSALRIWLASNGDLKTDRTKKLHSCQQASVLPLSCPVASRLPVHPTVRAGDREAVPRAESGLSTCGCLTWRTQELF